MSIDFKTLSLAKNSAKSITLDKALTTVPEWTSGKSYVETQLISYDYKLYKLKKDITKSIYSPDLDNEYFQLLDGSGTSSSSVKFPGFTQNNSYSYGECIVVNNCLYSAKASFTSGDAFDSNNWNVISDMQRNIYDTNFNGIVDKAEYALVAEKSLETDLIQSWSPNTDYTIGQNLFYNYETYTVTTNFISGATFDATNLLLSGTGNHNNLRSLQGGKDTSNEFYHLSKDKHDVVENFTMSGNKVAYNSVNLGDMFKSVYDSNNDGVIDKATTLDGLSTTIAELNYVHGVTGNIQAQIDALSSIGNFTGSVATYADIDLTFTDPQQKDMVIVIADENNGGTSTIYLYDGSAWVYSGGFTADIRDFSTNPLDVTLESTGLYLEDRIDPLIARLSDVPTFSNLSLLQSYTQKDSDLTSAVNKMHSHSNKTLLDSYTQTNVDLGDAVNKKHSHSNKTILDKITEDASGNPLYNGNPIGSGTGSSGGITDLSLFNTGDLVDSTNHRYVTDAEKTNLQNLTTVVATQTTITTAIANMNSVIPTDASSSNKLVSNDTLTSKLSGLKITDLSDVTNPLVSDSFVVVNAAGDGIEYKSSITDLIKIKKVTDSDSIEFLDVPSFIFHNLVGEQDPTTGELTLSLKAYSTDMLDMPTEYVDDSVLVSNASLQKYELKSLSDLTNSKENFSQTIEITDWVLDTDTGLYYSDIVHSLDSKNLVICVYDSEDNNVLFNYQILDNNTIAIKSTLLPTQTYRMIINCSQGTLGDGSGGGITAIYASDFIDDTKVRTDKTYSSSKITSVLANYAQKNTVYTQAQATALFATKTNEHIHSNLTILNALTTDTDNNLYYKGTKLLTGSVDPITYQNHWTDQIITSESLLFDVNSIFLENKYNAILNTELVLINNIESVDETTDAEEINQLHLIVIDNAITVLDVLIPPGSTQKYELGISPNLKVMIKGSFSGNYYLTAY